MRRLITTALVLSAILIAGCGGGDDSGSALDSALSYLPKDAPFAMAIDTDLEGDQYQALQAHLNKFPFGDQLEQTLRQQLEPSSGGGDFDEDIRPMFGNPLVVGGTDLQELTGESSERAFIVVLRVKDRGKLDDLVDRRKPRELGEESGATLYESEGTVIAIEDDVVVFGRDHERVTQALERADGDDHLDEEAFNESLSGLPETALARVYADLEAIIEADPGTADARRVEWVGALRTLGVTVSARDDGLDVDFRLGTEGDLSDEDLPIAPGDDSPSVIKRDGEIGLGIRDLAHIVTFAENAAQAVNPAGFGDYAQAKKTIDRQLGVSLDNDLVGQLTGDVSASVSIDGKFGVRAQLEDPRAFERTLAKVSDVLPNFAEGAGFGTVALSKPRGGEDFYALAQPDGDVVVFGVVDDVLVVANDPERAGELAAAEPADVSGAKGSVVMSADAEELVNTLLREFGPAFGLGDLGVLGGALFTRPLGDLNAFMSVSPDELSGKLTLAID